jgi:hypothetical protein
MPGSERGGKKAHLDLCSPAFLSIVTRKRLPASFLRLGDDVLVFLIPCVGSGAMLTYFLTGFHSHFSTVDRAGASIVDLPPRPESVRGTVGWIGNLVTESADG